MHLYLPETDTVLSLDFWYFDMSWAFGGKLARLLELTSEKFGERIKFWMNADRRMSAFILPVLQSEAMHNSVAGTDMQIRRS